uniref:Phospholipid scramblase n=1 Tax=Cyprinus carpio TaxID=7962 RepID=A0A8C2C432_CYPCA
MACFYLYFLSPNQASPSVTTQPLPFGLEREKHIDMLFRAFHRQIRPTTDMQDLTPVLRDTGRTREQDEGPGWKETYNERLEKLSVLRTVTRLHITARPELQGPQCVARRTYSISTESSDQLFVAVEESSCMCMQCCGPARSCSLQGFDKDAECVFLFERPLRSEMCWLGCCLMEIKAYTPERELIGTVHQRWSMFTPYFEVCDSEGISAVRIQGSCCNTRCLSEQELQLVSNIGERIGRIWKRWPGYNEECNMDHEYFGLDGKINIHNHMFFEMS